MVIPRGGENTVILADGTTVHLNAGSKLTYPVRFAGKRRVVALEGEAYFDVVKDETRPFIVQTHLGEVTVLGTAFNINAYTMRLFTQRWYTEKYSSLHQASELLFFRRGSRLWFLPTVRKNVW